MTPLGTFSSRVYLDRTRLIRLKATAVDTEINAERDCPKWHHNTITLVQHYSVCLGWVLVEFEHCAGVWESKYCATTFFTPHILSLLLQS